MSFRTTLNAIALVILAGTAGFAQAQVTLYNNSNTDTVSPGFGIGSDKTSSTNFTSNNNASWTSNGVGALSLSTSSNGASSFWAYCIDPNTGVTFPSSTYATASLNDFMDGTANSGYATQIGRSGYSSLGMSNSAAAQSAVRANLIELFSRAYNDSLTSNIKSAAFGMAVWEIITQDASTNTGSTGFSNTAGRVRSKGSDNAYNTDTLEAQTNIYLSALSNNTWGTGATAGLTSVVNWTYTVYYDTTSTYSQQFIRVTDGTQSQPLPIPGTLALAGLALFAATRARSKARGNA